MSTSAAVVIEMPSFGFKLPNCGGIMCAPEWARPDIVLDLARHAEACGFDALWLHEHLAMPEEHAHLGPTALMEPMTVMAHVLAAAPTVRVGTAALVLPLHDPVALARRLLTMEAFAPGRVIAGVGSGQFRSEFAALGSDRFGQRGRVMEESLVLLRRLFDDDVVTFAGEFQHLAQARFYSTALTTSRPPLWVAGGARAAIERAGRLADGWICVGLDPAEVRGARAAAASAASAAGRGSDDFATALSTTISRAGRPGRAGGLHEHRRGITGDAQAVTDSLYEYVDAGVDHFIITFAVSSIEEVRADMEWFTTDVVPLLVERQRRVA